MKIPPAFGKWIQGVPSALAVIVQPGAKQATPVLALASFHPEDPLPRETRGLVHLSAAISPQTNSNSKRSSLKGQGIISEEQLSSLGHHPGRRLFLSYGLSGSSEVLRSSALAMKALNEDAMHLSVQGVMLLCLMRQAKRGESMGISFWMPCGEVFSSLSGVVGGETAVEGNGLKIADRA